MEWNIANRASGEFGSEDRWSAVVNPRGRPPGYSAEDSPKTLRRSVQARVIPALIAILAGAYAPIWAADGSEGNDGANHAIPAVAGAVYHGHEETVEPWVHRKMAPNVRAQLEAGFDLAVERLREIAACSDLFTKLGTNGIEMLKTGLYLPVHSYRHEVVVCGRDPAANSREGDILAYTQVGGAPTWICRNFARVSIETAAVAVIHEALHHAGMSEWPRDRTAMSSVEITEMIKRQCGF